MRRILNAALAVMLASLATPAWADGAQAAIEAGAVAFVEADASGDGGQVAALYTEDGAVLPPGGTQVDGRDGIAAFWQGAIDSGLVLTGIEPLEISESGDQAVDIGFVHLSAPDGEGGMTALTAKYIVIWQRGADGVWRLHRDIWNLNP